MEDIQSNEDDEAGSEKENSIYGDKVNMYDAPVQDSPEFNMRGNFINDHKNIDQEPLNEDVKSPSKAHVQPDDFERNNSSFSKPLGFGGKILKEKEDSRGSFQYSVNEYKKS